MKFDEIFYYQENRDGDGNVVPFDSDFCTMRGTEGYPVYAVGMIEASQLDCDISEALIDPPDQITLKIILNGRLGYVKKEKSYYMKFILYDFDRLIHLFLLDAKVLKINKISSIYQERLCLIITSQRCKLIEEYHNE